MAVTVTKTELKRFGYEVAASGNVVKIRAEDLPAPNGMAGPSIPVTFVQPRPLYKSGWEAERAEYWELQRRAGTIRTWRYEPLRLRLAEGAWFKPDFLVEWIDDAIMLEEIKGQWREAALVRFKVARDMYPMFLLRAVTKRGGQWVDAMEGRR